MTKNFSHKHVIRDSRKKQVTKDSHVYQVTKDASHRQVPLLAGYYPVTEVRTFDWH